jgi:hypothetical protein
MGFHGPRLGLSLVSPSWSIASGEHQTSLGAFLASKEEIPNLATMDEHRELMAGSLNGLQTRLSWPYCGWFNYPDHGGIIKRSQ